MSSNVLNLIQRTVSSMTESRKYDYQTCNSNIEIIHSIHIMVQMIREERILDTDQEYHKMVMVAVSYKVK